MEKNIRTNSRIIAMMLLFNLDINKELNNNNFDNNNYLNNYLLEAINDNSISSNNPSEEKIEYDLDFVKEIVNGVINNLSTIDFKLSIAIVKYTLDRISIVDRNLLRIGAYEILFTDTPANIVINEIVNISKEYSEIDDYKTSKFNNAVLDKLAKNK
ncbi:MAG: transcription antitermination factor NusB [Bacilli bacterium]|nr:transcription antitermination factor NusB [Bacilli bacterium]